MRAFATSSIPWQNHEYGKHSVGLITENEVILDLIDRKLDMEIGMLDRILDKSKGRMDYMWMGEDLGTQNAPMISLDLYRKILRPRHQKFIDLAKAYAIPVMFHNCGSSSWVMRILSRWV